MTTQHTFLSIIIQCCPNAERQELINIGVMTILPKTQQWEVLIAEHPPLALQAIEPGALSFYSEMRKTVLDSVAHYKQITDRTSEKFLLETIQEFCRPREQMIRFLPPRPHLGSSLDEELLKIYKRMITYTVPA